MQSNFWPAAAVSVQRRDVSKVKGSLKQQLTLDQPSLRPARAPSSTLETTRDSNYFSLLLMVLGIGPVALIMCANVCILSYASSHVDKIYSNSATTQSHPNIENT
jgi:hypothetical protein